MAGDIELEPNEPSPQAPSTDGTSFWERIHQHKVIQWSVGYLGAALALAHGAELVGHAFHWPDIVSSRPDARR